MRLERVSAGVKGPFRFYINMSFTANAPRAARSLRRKNNYLAALADQTQELRPPLRGSAPIDPSLMKPPRLCLPSMYIYAGRGGGLYDPGVSCAIPRTALRHLTPRLAFIYSPCIDREDSEPLLLSHPSMGKTRDQQ